MYNPVILDSEIDYPSIRLALSSDESLIGDDLIEAWPFLPTSEAIIRNAVSDWATYLADTDSANYVLLKAATALMCAARIAASNKWSAQGSEVKQKQIGTGFSYTLRDGPNWGAIAESLARDASDLLAQLLNANATVDTKPPKPGAMAGPTKARRDANAVRDWCDWKVLIEPDIIRMDAL